MYLQFKANQMKIIDGFNSTETKENNMKELINYTWKSINTYEGMVPIYQIIIYK